MTSIDLCRRQDMGLMTTTTTWLFAFHDLTKCSTRTCWAKSSNQHWFQKRLMRFHNRSIGTRAYSFASLFGRDAILKLVLNGTPQLGSMFSCQSYSGRKPAGSFRTSSPNKLRTTLFLIKICRFGQLPPWMLKLKKPSNAHPKLDATKQHKQSEATNANQ